MWVHLLRKLNAVRLLTSEEVELAKAANNFIPRWHSKKAITRAVKIVIAFWLVKKLPEDPFLILKEANLFSEEEYNIGLVSPFWVISKTVALGNNWSFWWHQKTILWFIKSSKTKEIWFKKYRSYLNKYGRLLEKYWFTFPEWILRVCYDVAYTDFEANWFKSLRWAAFIKHKMEKEFFTPLRPAIHQVLVMELLREFIYN